MRCSLRNKKQACRRVNDRNKFMDGVVGTQSFGFLKKITKTNKLK